MIDLHLIAAFNTVDHSILIKFLECQYGVCGSELEWMDSYIRPGSCRVSFNCIVQNKHVNATSSLSQIHIMPYIIFKRVN